MKYGIALGLLICLTPAVSRAAKYPEAQKTFQEANDLFESGQVDDAMNRYHALHRQGFGGADLSYNLGNAHYRRGERGQSILWYERALLASPRDTDIQFNLSLARSHIKDESISLYHRAITYFTSNELAVAVSFFSILFFTVIGLRLLGQITSDTWPTVAMFSFGTLLLLSGSWLGLRAMADQTPYAVVVSPPGEVRNGPGEDYAVGFTVPEGSRILVLSDRPGWTQVGVPEQGLKGWMPSEQIEKISTSAFS